MSADVMQCPTCQRPNAAEAHFCISCGAALGPSAPGEGSEAHGDLPQSSVENALREVRKIVADLSDRMTVVEAAVGGPGPRRPSPEATPTTIFAAAPTGVPMDARASTAVLPGETAAALGGLPRDDIEPSGPASWFRFAAVPLRWEQVVGLNWLAIVGAVALAVGVGFFLRLAFENNWIGEGGRVILGLVAGAGLLASGEYAQRRYPAWAHAVTGGGMAILYLAIYAAFGFYALLSPALAFLLLALLAGLGALLAVRYESLIIALLGVGGAYLTPMLLGRDLRPEEHYLLLIYLLLVDAGVLSISALRNWRWVVLLGLVASYGLFALWLYEYPVRDLALAQTGLTGMFLLFVGATTLFHILWRRKPGAADLALLTCNAVAYYGLTFAILWDNYAAWFGVLTLGLALFYALVGSAALKRSAAPPEIALYAVAAALVFLTVAAPLQLSGSWITIAWAAEGAVLTSVGFTVRSWLTRAFGLGVFAVAALHLLFFDTPVDLEGFRPILNGRFLTFSVAIAASYVAALVYQRHRDRSEPWEANTALVLTAAANLLTLWILSAEAIAYFDHQALTVSSYEAGLANDSGRWLSLTALWAIYAMGLLAVAWARRTPALRWAGLALLSLPALKLLLVDTFVVQIDPQTYTLVLNYPFLTFLTVMGAILFATLLYSRQRPQAVAAERFALIGLVVVANVVAVWGLSAEALRFFDAREMRQATNLTSAKHLSLTILWAVYAIGVIGVGIARRSGKVRLAGLVLLGLPVLKLFGFDVFLLERGYRVTAFVTLGVLLLATGLVYQRFSDRIKEFFAGHAS